MDAVKKVRLIAFFIKAADAFLSTAGFVGFQPDAGVLSTYLLMTLKTLLFQFIPHALFWPGFSTAKLLKSRDWVSIIPWILLLRLNVIPRPELSELEEPWKRALLISV